MQNDFYSMDRLVEFGMNMAVANQMVGSMNQTLKQMDIPGTGKAEHPQPEAVYYAAIDGKQEDPYSITEIGRLITDKKIVKETYVWKTGMEKWDLAQNVDEILRLVALTPPPIPKSPKQ